MAQIPRAGYYLGMVGVLLLSAWIAVFHLDRESIWYDEGFTVFVVHNDADTPEGLRASVGYVVDSVVGVFERARTDVHPLLYYLVVDAWTLVMGEAVWVLRLPSVFFGLIGLAATYALGRTLFDRPTGLIGALLLGIAHFYIYYNREARMYTLLVALTILLMLATVRWCRRPTVRHGLIMGLYMGLLMHTHYIGALVIIGILLYQVYFVVRTREFMGVGRWLLPHVTGFLVFFPWLPFAIEQLTGHPNGPLGQVVFPTEWGTVTWLWDIMTSSHGGLFFIGFLIGGGLFCLRQRNIQHAMILLVIWFIVTPLGLLAINATGRAVLVARYTLVSLPALTLACAYGLRHLSTTPSFLSRFKLETAGAIVGIFLLAWIVVTQLTTYSTYWGDKPRWEEALEQLEDIRQADEPAIVDFIPHNVATYYARQYDFKQGVSIDIGWNDFVPEQLHDFADRIDAADSVWAILPSDSSKTWYTIPKLAQGRTIGYRDSVQNMIFYRFDRSEDTSSADIELSYYAGGFGRLLAYRSGIGHRYFAETGREFCFPLQLEALQDVGDDWHLLVSLTQGFNTPRAETTFDLPAFNEGDLYDETLCIDIPADSPRGPHLLRVAMQHQFGYHQPVVESDEDLLWGFFIGVAWVAVDDPAA